MTFVASVLAELMPFLPGATVVVRPIGNKRGVVIDVGRSGQYRVQVENAVVSCRERDLAAPPAQAGKKQKHRGPKPKAPETDAPNPAAPPGRADLHGLTVEEAIAAVDQQMDHALRRGADRLEIVHGKGSGRIREALHRHLATIPAVSAFKLDPRNTGVTWVYF